MFDTKVFTVSELLGIVTPPLRKWKTSMNCEVYIIHVAILYSGVCVSVDKCNGNRGAGGSGA